MMKKNIILMLFYVVFSVNAMEKRDTKFTSFTSYDVCTAESLVMFSRAAHEEKPEKRRKMIDADSEEPVKLLCNTQKGERGLFACSVCGKIFEVRSQCVLHEGTHQKLKPFKCHFCEKRYSKKHNRDVHEFVHEK